MNSKRPPPPRICYVQYANPACYPPLEHSSRILARDSWQVLFLGTGAALGADNLRFPPHPNIVIDQLAACPAGWRQKLHYLWFCLWIAWRVLCWRPQWIYASDPLSCPAALPLCFIPGSQVIYHEHDSPHAASYSRRFVFWARKKVARRAQLCVLPNEQRLEHFSKEINGGAKVLCVWNCPTQEEVVAARGGRQQDALEVLYHGAIVPNRLLAVVVEALAMLPGVIKLRIVGYETIGHRGYVQQLRTRAAELQIAHRVEWVGAMPRKELFEQCRQCDVGLALVPKESSDVNIQHLTGASNKPFDYLACGLALLVADLPDWKRMYVDPGYGLACNPEDPESVAQALRWFLEHPRQTRAMGEQGRRRILSEWNYDKQFAPIVERLEGKG